MNKPSRPVARPLRDSLGKVVGETFTRQGFASAELVTRWAEIVGAEIAAHQRADQDPMAARRTDPGEIAASPGHAGAARRRPGGNRNPALAPGDLRTGQSFLRLARRRALAFRQAPLRRGVKRKPTRRNRMPRPRRGLPRTCPRSRTRNCGGAGAASVAAVKRHAEARDSSCARRRRVPTTRGAMRWLLAERRRGATFRLPSLAH